MKKRYLFLPAALVLAALLCFWLLTSDSVCIGRIEERSDALWSQLHVYMNNEIEVDFPIDGDGKVCVFQYETGRGSFTARITDAAGQTLYSDSSDKNGSFAFLADSDLKLRIKGQGHGGVFALTRRDDLTEVPDLEAGVFRLQGEGNHIGGTFTKSFECLKFDGKYLNFYVENNGTAPVIITINGEHGREIPAGGSGHISATISAPTLPQKLTISCSSDEEVNIYWKAAQRSSKNG